MYTEAEIPLALRMSCVTGACQVPAGYRQPLSTAQLAGILVGSTIGIVSVLILGVMLLLWRYNHSMMRSLDKVYVLIPLLL